MKLRYTPSTSATTLALLVSVACAVGCSPSMPSADAGADSSAMDVPTDMGTDASSDSAPPSDSGMRPGTTADAMCMENCMADGDVNTRQVCGTTGTTYSYCAWECAQVPAGVSVYPGACNADGTPPADRPPTPADGTHVCDWIKIGTSWISLACGSDLDDPIMQQGDDLEPTDPPADGGTAPDASEPDASAPDASAPDASEPDASAPDASAPDASAPDASAPDASAPDASRPGPSIDPMMLPDRVDHRARFGAAENQGSVGACTAFATTAGLESALAARGLRTDLSEQHLWLRYCQPSMEPALEAARRGIAAKTTADMRGFMYDGASATGRAKMCETRGTPDTDAQMMLDTLAQFSVTSVDEIEPTAGNMAPTPEQLRRAIGLGNDVVIAVSLNSAEWSSPPSNTIPESNVRGASGHAVLLVGYERRGTTWYFLMRNSWGDSWADRGYAWVSENYLRAHLYRPAFTIQASCERCLSSIPNCPAGQAASSIDGTCRRQCPDGSLANAMDQCPPPPMCAAEFVNDPATTSCVPACRMGTFNYASGITQTCRPAGCTVNIPVGTNGCTTAGGCTLHCPAPQCSIGTSRNEFGNPITVCMRPSM
jgi:hypothetical protein